MLEANELRELALDVREGKVFEDEVERFLYNINIVIRDYAKNGAFQVGISYQNQVDDGVGVYKIDIPKFISEDSARLFLDNIFKDVKSDLLIRGFSVFKMEYKLLPNTKYHQCDYTLVVEW